MPVKLQRPTLRQEEEFLRLARASRRLHRPWVSPPQTAAAYRAYVGRLSKDRHEGYLVRVQPGGELAGVVNLNEIVRGGLKSAYLGYYAFAPLAGQGHLREGLARVLDLAFGKLGLHRLEANIQPQNRRSIRLVRGLGFQREGFSRRYLKIGGRWRDHERWALLAEDWK